MASWIPCLKHNSFKKMPAYDGDYHVHPGVFQYSLNKNYNVFKGACRGTRAFLICRNLSISAACVCRGSSFPICHKETDWKGEQFYERRGLGSDY